MIVLYGCGIIALISAFCAAGFSDTRRAVLALWLSGVSVGGVFLFFQIELLAVTQWIVSTLIAMGFLFYERIFREKPDSISFSSLVVPVSVAICFFTILWLTLRSVAPEISQANLSSYSLGKKLGDVLSQRHLLSLEVIGLSILLVIVGAGVISRSALEKGDQ